ncbi:MAG: hypothetical protein AB1304_11735, partial [Bacteroidota bacterium]
MKIDNVATSTFTKNIDNQTINNYIYDSTGNLIKDSIEGLEITWTHYGKVKQIKKNGNVMAIYEDRNDSLMLEELHIYGSQRLGVIKENRLLAKYVNIFPPSSTFKTSMPNTPLIPYPYTLTPYHFGKKHYELADW